MRTPRYYGHPGTLYAAPNNIFIVPFSLKRTPWQYFFSKRNMIVNQAFFMYTVTYTLYCFCLLAEVFVIQTSTIEDKLWNRLDTLRQKALPFCIDILHPKIGKLCSHTATANSRYYGHEITVLRVSAITTLYLKHQFSQYRSQPDNLVMLCKFKSLSLFISLEINSFYSL